VFDKAQGKLARFVLLVVVENSIAQNSPFCRRRKQGERHLLGNLAAASGLEAAPEPFAPRIESYSLADRGNLKRLPNGDFLFRLGRDGFRPILAEAEVENDKSGRTPTRLIEFRANLETGTGR